MCSGKSAAYDKIDLTKRFSFRTIKTASAGKVKHGKYSSNSEINLKTETPFSRSKCSSVLAINPLDKNTEKNSI